MTLVCQAHSTAGEQFDLLWLALFLQQESPTELSGPMYEIKQTAVEQQVGIVDIESTLHFATADSLSKVFCQVQLKNQSRLSPSQALELSSIPSSPTCNFSSSTWSLVNRTSTCILHTSLPHSNVPQGPPGDMSSALYVVLGLIAVFIVVIVVLTVVVVLLYRRKCRGKAKVGRPGVEGTGERSVQGPAGFTNRCISLQLLGILYLDHCCLS